MSSELKMIVVCTQQNHPTGRRNRAGLSFTAAPAAYEVTAEQEAAIKADPFLRIVEKGTARQDAIDNFQKKTESSEPSAPSDTSAAPASTPSSLEPTAEKSEGVVNNVLNPELPATTEPETNGSDAGATLTPSTPENTNTSDPASTVTDPVIDPTLDPANTSDPATGNVTDPAVVEKPISRMNKDELVVALEKKGLVAGKDFEPAAANKKLAALLETL